MGRKRFIHSLILGLLLCSPSYAGVSSESDFKGKHISTPSAPAAGYDKMYFKSDDFLYRLTSGSAEDVFVLGAATQTLTGKTLNAADNVVHADDAVNVLNADYGDITVSGGAWAIDSGTVGADEIADAYIDQTLTQASTPSFVGMNLGDSAITITADDSGVSSSGTITIDSVGSAALVLDRGGDTFSRTARVRYVQAGAGGFTMGLASGQPSTYFDFTDASGNAMLSITDAGTTGNITVSGDLTITGDDLVMATNTSGVLLIADGTNFNPTAVSGDATISSAGVVTVGDDSHAHTTTTISGIDISDDTNLAGTLNEITLTGDTLSAAAAMTRDVEWDTVAEINSATTDFNLPFTLWKSTGPVTATGAGFVNLASITIPANTLGADGWIRCRLALRRTTGSGNVSYRLAESGSALITSAAGSSSIIHLFVDFANQDATNSQILYMQRGHNSAETPATSALDTTGSLTLTIDVDLTTDTDVVTAYYGECLCYPT